jgi:arsenate reductase
MMIKRRVLFLCTHNAARSQMAEGYVRAKYADRWETESAGVKPGELNPHAIKAMSELGIDISHHRSKSLKEFHGQHFDVVVTVCSDAADTCPFFPGDMILHMDFPDPAGLKGDQESVMTGTRYIRDQITTWIDRELPKW